MNLLEMCAQISMKIINIATESTTRSMIGKSITIVGAGEEVGMVETKGLIVPWIVMIEPLLFPLITALITSRET